jgi:hypothetical protein
MVACGDLAAEFCDAAVLRGDRAANCGKNEDGFHSLCVWLVFLCHG